MGSVLSELSSVNQFLLSYAVADTRVLLDVELWCELRVRARPLLFTIDERLIGSIESEVSLSELRDRPLFTMVERRIGSMESDFSLSSIGFDTVDLLRLDRLAFDGL